MSSVYKISLYLLLFKILIITSPFEVKAQENFENWLINYKQFVLKEGISQKTINIAFKNVKFLEDVIKYDRKQPEFYEDTITYISKRATSGRANRKVLNFQYPNAYLDSYMHRSG